MRISILALLVLVAVAAHGADDRPNLLLIVADDLGYGDLGSFGGDIRTPNVDALAERGVRFSQFHTAPYCAPTRAMLLSGNNNHVAGMGQQVGRDDTRPVRQMPGYEGHLSDRVTPLPAVLKAAGYHTYSVGKWHLGSAEAHSPKAAGFERSFNLLDGAGNHFNAVGFFDGGSLYRADGELVEWPEGAYSTELYTDKLIEFIDSNVADGRPFFAFAAYTSPHWPLQVPDGELQRYAGRYDRGYDWLREERFRSLQAAGIIPTTSRLPPRNDAITPWNALSAEEQRREARKMELYAAMVENLDHHVGRLLAHLESIGAAEDTIVVFMSDNGAAAEDFYNDPRRMAYVRARYDNSPLEDWGRASTWVSYGPQWAEAGSAPFRFHKSYATEGGTVAPLIVAGPGVARAGHIDRSYVTVMDIAPTFIELARGEYLADGAVVPMLGESMSALLEGSSSAVHGDDYVTALFHRNQAFLRQGRWKLTAISGPFTEAAFALYDIENDPGETQDLSEEAPAQRARMIELWREERVRLGITLPSDL